MSHDRNKTNDDDELDPVVFASCFSLLAAAVHPCLHCTLSSSCAHVFQSIGENLRMKVDFHFQWKWTVIPEKLESRSQGLPSRSLKRSWMICLYSLKTHDPWNGAFPTTAQLFRIFLSIWNGIFASGSKLSAKPKNQTWKPNPGPRMQILMRTHPWPGLKIDCDHDRECDSDW